MALFPDEALYTMTAMSERALIYLDESLAHRTVVLYEAAARREGREKAEDNQTAYIVRSLLSEGRIEYPVVQRGDDGTLRTVKLVKEGPTNLITTTTSISLHGENETRMISLPSNDSKTQTRAVLISSSADPHTETVCTGTCTHLGDDEIPGEDCDCTGVCRCASDAGGRETPAAVCTICGEPLAQSFIDAGFTDHGEEAGQ